MKSKILIALTAIFVLGLSIAVYAFNQTNNSAKTSASCCAKSDSCPMKGKNAEATGDQTKASCCDKDNCCCKGDSCPMKSSGDTASTGCCGACCGGDSCPMKDKETQAATTDLTNVTVASGESCCQKGASCCSGGACCKSKS